MRNLLLPCLALHLLLQSIPLSAQDNNKGLSIKSQQAGASAGRTWALIVGISDYKNLPKLQFADVDAKDFHHFLSHSAPGDTANFRLYTNADATREAIVDQLYHISENAKKGDRVFLFFSGHGDMEQLTRTDNSLFLLAESPQKNYLRKTEYVDMNLLRDFLVKWQEEDVKTIFIADACHSGALSGGEEGRNNTVLSLRQSWKNEIKLLSCQPNELSLESTRFGGGRGLFSYYLTLGLRGLADKDNNKVVSLFELDGFIRDSVSFYSDQAQLPATHGDLRFQLSPYAESSLAVARTMLKNKMPLYDKSVAFKAAKTDPVEAMIADEAWKQKYRDFLLSIRQGRLVKPENNNAVYYYQLFRNAAGMEHIAGLMKLKFLEAIKKRFYELTDKMYDDNFGTIPAIYIENVLKETEGGLQLLDQSHYSYKLLLARKAFLESCKRTYYLNSDRRPADYLAALQKEIAALETAIETDPMQPYLYLRLGDYTLAANQPGKAIEYYRKYQLFLPNDEYAWLKLGLAYMATNDLKSAREQFEKSIKLNPRFAKGYYQLYQVCIKTGRTAEAAHYAKLANTYGKFPDLQDNRDIY